MNKQLIFFLLLVAVVVAAMVAYHRNTPSPYNSPVFFGAPEEPEPEPDMGKKPTRLAPAGQPSL